MPRSELCRGRRLRAAEKLDSENSAHRCPELRFLRRARDRYLTRGPRRGDYAYNTDSKNRINLIVTLATTNSQNSHSTVICFSRSTFILVTSKQKAPLLFSLCLLYPLKAEAMLARHRTPLLVARRSSPLPGPILSALQPFRQPHPFGRPNTFGRPIIGQG